MRVLIISAGLIMLAGCGGGGVSRTATPEASSNLASSPVVAAEASSATPARGMTGTEFAPLAPADTLSFQLSNAFATSAAVHSQDVALGRMLPPINKPGSGKAALGPLLPSGNVGTLISIVVTPATPAILLGQTQQFTATGYYRGGYFLDLTTSVAWWSSAAGVATINKGGLATTVSAGSTTITATMVEESPLGSSDTTAPGVPAVPAPSGLTVGSTSLAVTAPLAAINDSSLTFGPQFQDTTSTAQTITLRNMGTAVLNIAGIALMGNDAGDFATTTNCGNTLAAGSNCTVNVTFTPVASGSLSATLVITDNSNEVAGSTQTVMVTGNGFYDVSPVSVNLGPAGNYPNDVLTSVTVCVPGTSNCTTIPDVQVDTGSVGLRLLSSGADDVTGAQVGSLGLTQITDSSTGYPLYECVLFGDLSYTWGPMVMATVTVGGETAAQLPGGGTNSGIPIQIITSSTPPEGVYDADGQDGPGPYYNPCTYPMNGENESQTDADTVANLGSNGILGIGNFPQDCAIATSNYCTNLSTTTGQYLEYDSTGILTADGTLNYVVEPTPLEYQAWNPVATFPIDKNGSILNLPSVPASGSATATGTLTFGIGTEANNAMTTQTVYEVDPCGNFPQAEYNGITYASDTNTPESCTLLTPSFIESGSNALYILDESLLSVGGVSVGDCMSGTTDTGWYCPTSTQNLLPLTLTGYNSTSTSVTLSVANEIDLVNSGNAAFNNLAAPSCAGGSAAGCSASTDFIDLGLPFFFGQPIFTGISGGTTYPNGYWAF